MTFAITKQVPAVNPKSLSEELNVRTGKNNQTNKFHLGQILTVKNQTVAQ